MRARSPITAATWLAAGLALSGCAVGPNFSPPAPPSPSSYGVAAQRAQTSPGGQQIAPGAPVDAAWWRRFGSSSLDDLMDRALAHNADLAAASAALRVSKETYLAQRGILLPSLDAQAQGQRARNSQALAPPLSNNAVTYNLFSTQLDVGYTLDVFGGSRRTVEAAHAQAEQQRFQSEGAFLSLTANIANGFIQLAALREQLRLTEALAEADHRVVVLTQLQHAKGQVSGVELSLAENQYAAAQANVPSLQKQVAQQLDLLASLTGRTPGEASSVDARLDDLHLPAELPLSLPVQLVRQRPDLRAAEAGVHAASAQLGVAIANRLPNITLAADAGGAATQVGSMLTQPNQLWSIGETLAQPIFQGGALVHRQRAAHAALDQAQAQYRSTLLDALQNVADTLAAISTDAEAWRAEAAAEDAANRGARLAEVRRRAGDTSELDALAAQASALQASIVRVQAQAARLSDSAALFVALGGGWWDRADFGPKPTRSQTRRDDR